jgi:integrase/recombinase XerD
LAGIRSERQGSPLLDGGGSLEDAQAMAAHESPRTTKLYDRTGDEITLDEVERIKI